MLRDDIFANIYGHSVDLKLFRQSQKLKSKCVFNECLLCHLYSY